MQCLENVTTDWRERVNLGLVEVQHGSRVSMLGMLAFYLVVGVYAWWRQERKPVQIPELKKLWAPNADNRTMEEELERLAERGVLSAEIGDSWRDNLYWPGEHPLIWIPETITLCEVVVPGERVLCLVDDNAALGTIANGFARGASGLFSLGLHAVCDPANEPAAINMAEYRIAQIVAKHYGQFLLTEMAVHELCRQSFRVKTTHHDTAEILDGLVQRRVLANHAERGQSPLYSLGQRFWVYVPKGKIRTDKMSREEEAVLDAVHDLR